MRRSDLKQSMVFQAPSTSTPTVWTTIFTCKGAWWGLSQAESVQAMALGGTITGKVRIDYRPVKIRTTWRIKVDQPTGETILNIVGPPININGDNKILEMRIKEVG